MTHKSPSGLVYVVDDDDAVRDSHELLLFAAGFAVVAFASAEAFLAQARGPERACLLSDIRMPGKSGIELLEAVKSQSGECPVILITGRGDVPLAVDAMKRGAVDFIEKPFDDERMIAAIRAALERPATIGDAAVIDPANAERVASLSGRERQVMERLVDSKSNEAIAREHGISPRTVDVYRADVMSKMQAASLSELAQLAVRAKIARP